MDCKVSLSNYNLKMFAIAPANFRVCNGKKKKELDRLVKLIKFKSKTENDIPVIF